MTVTVYHNPRCSKSRATLALLQERDIDPEVVLYLEQAPTRAELESILAKLGMTPRALARTKESAWAEAGLGPDSSDAEILEAMTRHPVLIERPIVISGDRAALGRPPENVLEILDS